MYVPLKRETGPPLSRDRLQFGAGRPERLAPMPTNPYQPPGTENCRLANMAPPQPTRLVLLWQEKAVHIQNSNVKDALQGSYGSG
jgi:hypothetical protein